MYSLLCFITQWVKQHQCTHCCISSLSELNNINALTHCCISSLSELHNISELTAVFHHSVSSTSMHTLLCFITQWMNAIPIPSTAPHCTSWRHSACVNGPTGTSKTSRSLTLPDYFTAPVSQIPTVFDDYRFIRLAKLQTNNIDDDAAAF